MLEFDLAACSFHQAAIRFAHPKAIMLDAGERNRLTTNTPRGSFMKPTPTSPAQPNVIIEALSFKRATPRHSSGSVLFAWARLRLHLLCRLSVPPVLALGQGLAHCTNTRCLPAHEPPASTSMLGHWQGGRSQRRDPSLDWPQLVGRSVISDTLG